MFSVLRPFIFNLDPETAHDLAIKSLKLNILPKKTRLIDLSADFRIKDPKIYKKWYGINHKSKNFIQKSIYAITEFARNNLGKYEDAMTAYKRAIQLKPDYANAHLNLGIILKDLGQLKEAELSTRKAIELKSDYAEALLNLGIILKDLGKLKESELSFRKVIEIKPKTYATVSSF